MVKIVGIAGSLRAGSHSHQALQLAAQRVEALGAEVELLDLRSLQLPFCDAWNAFDTEGKLLDEKLSQRLDQLAQSLVENTERLRK